MDRSATEAFILENFANIQQDYPWEDTPDACIFRHADNRKWFALLMRIPYHTLHLDLPGHTDFINLKSDPDLIESLQGTPGFLPAYHMNKTHWITALLDGTADPEKLQHLILLSYQLTSTKPRKIPPRPPKSCYNK